MKHYIKHFKRILIPLFNFTFRPNVYSSNAHIKTRIDKHSSLMQNVWIDKYSNVGSYTYIAQGVVISKSSIGNYCSVAPYAKIGLGEHNYNKISTSVRFSTNPFEELTKEDCTIGNDVWIGTNAVILRGIKIGDGAVIGANAVVTKDVPSFAIVAGVPAKILKYRFSEEKIERIKKSQWWNFQLKKAKIIIENLENEK